MWSIKTRNARQFEIYQFKISQLHFVVWKSVCCTAQIVCVLSQNTLQCPSNGLCVCQKWVEGFPRYTVLKQVVFAKIQERLTLESFHRKENFCTASVESRWSYANMCWIGVELLKWFCQKSDIKFQAERNMQICIVFGSHVPSAIEWVLVRVWG